MGGRPIPRGVTGSIRAGKVRHRQAPDLGLLTVNLQLFSLSCERAMVSVGEIVYWLVCCLAWVFQLLVVGGIRGSESMRRCSAPSGVVVGRRFFDGWLIC